MTEESLYNSGFLIVFLIQKYFFRFQLISNNIKKELLTYLLMTLCFKFPSNLSFVFT